MSGRFVRRWGHREPGWGRVFVEHNGVGPAELNEQFEAAGSSYRMVRGLPFALTFGWWDRDMNDICTDEEAARRRHEPVPDRFARIMPTETKPSTAKEAPPKPRP